MPCDQSDRCELLKSAIVEFGEAWAGGDRAALDALLAPGYTHHDAFGARLNRAAWLDYATLRRGRGTQIKFKDVEQRIFGDVAIVTGSNLVTGGGVRSENDTADLELVFTQVWIWTEARWRREAFQATPVLEREFS